MRVTPTGQKAGILKVGHLIAMKLKVGGVPARALIDTAATTSMIDPALVPVEERLIPKMVGTNLAHYQLHSRTEPTPLESVAFTADLDDVTVVNLRGAREGFDFLLGFDVLGATSLLMNIPEQTLRFIPPPRMLEMVSQVSFPLQLIDGIPIVTVPLEGRSTALVVDTGSDRFITLEESHPFFASRRGELINDRLRQMPSGAIMEQRVMVDGFSLGALAFRTRVGINAYPENRPAPFRGMIGLELLKDFVCFFDWRNRVFGLSG